MVYCMCKANGNHVAMAKGNHTAFKKTDYVKNLEVKFSELKSVDEINKKINSEMESEKPKTAMV